MFNKLKSALWISKVEREELKVERSAHIVVSPGKKDQLIGALGGGQLHRPDFPRTQRVVGRTILTQPQKLFAVMLDKQAARCGRR